MLPDPVARDGERALARFGLLGEGAARAVPAKIPLSQHNPRQVRLETETKLITHAIRMAACNAETILAPALHGTTPAPATGLRPHPRSPHHQRRHPPATRPCTCGSTRSPRPAAPRALAALCAQLNDTQTRYPGTTLTLRYEVKEHPGTA